MPSFTKQLLDRHAGPKAIISPRLREWFEPEPRRTPDRPFAQRGLLGGGNMAAPIGVGGSGHYGASGEYNTSGEYNAFGEFNASGDHNASGEHNASADHGITGDHNAPAGYNAPGEYGASPNSAPGSENRAAYRYSAYANIPPTQPANTMATTASMAGRQLEPNPASGANRTLAAAAPVIYPIGGTLRNGESWTAPATDNGEPGSSSDINGLATVETAGENALSRTGQPRAPQPPGKQKNAPDSPTYVQPIGAGRSKIAFPGSHRPTQQPTTANDTTIIRVSIGRIEIKAITPPPPPPAKRREPQKPKLSLDDFLSSRKSSQP